MNLEQALNKVYKKLKKTKKRHLKKMVKKHKNSDNLKKINPNYYIGTIG